MTAETAKQVAKWAVLITACGISFLFTIYLAIFHVPVSLCEGLILWLSPKSRRPQSWVVGARSLVLIMLMNHSLTLLWAFAYLPMKQPSYHVGSEFGDRVGAVVIVAAAASSFFLFFSQRTRLLAWAAR